jgi:predicted 3-demethylubiquinone-9 3-methyltransferase (glyoxalase superfamily)
MQLDIYIVGRGIFMKLEKTHFANRFAMLRDRFGTSWMLLHEACRGDTAPPQVVTFV